MERWGWEFAAPPGPITDLARRVVSDAYVVLARAVSRLDVVHGWLLPA
ncbi:hypothetical protein [Streptomyces sp. NPDC001508]